MWILNFAKIFTQFSKKICVREECNTRPSEIASILNFRAVDVELSRRYESCISDVLVNSRLYWLCMIWVKLSMERVIIEGIVKTNYFEKTGKH